MEAAVVATGGAVLVGYVAGFKKLPWKGLETLKTPWAVSAVATVVAYLYLFLWALEHSDDVLFFLLVFNSFALLWGWAYALFAGDLAEIVATAAVVGTAGVAATLVPVVYHAGAPADVIAMASVVAAHHILVDFVLWLGLLQGYMQYCSTASFCSSLCILSVLSVVSTGSVASFASVASVLSVNSVASFASIGCIGGVLEICH